VVTASVVKVGIYYSPEHTLAFNLLFISYLSMLNITACNWCSVKAWRKSFQWVNITTGLIIRNLKTFAFQIRLLTIKFVDCSNWLRNVYY